MWPLSIGVAVALGMLVWSEVASSGQRERPADAPGVDAEVAAVEPLDCDPGDTGAQGVFDYRIVDRDADRDVGTPRDAVAKRLLGPSGELHATIDEFVPGPRVGDRAEQRLVRDGRLLAVASLKLEPGVGWVVTRTAGLHGGARRPERTTGIAAMRNFWVEWPAGDLSSMLIDTRTARH